MDVKFRALMQLAEALGDCNRYHCSAFYGRSITDETVLLTYFIKNGGAKDFARRYAEAMGHANRWFAGEHFGRAIHDDGTLWRYYLSKTANRPTEPEATRCSTSIQPTLQPTH